MKLLSLICLTACLFVRPVWALNPGDIAFTGFNTDGTDNIAFVALTALPEGTVIRFTDDEWNGLALGAGGAFVDAAESEWTWTAPTGGLVAGSIVLIDSIGSGTITASVGAVSFSSSTNRGLSASGETVYAYEGSRAILSSFLAAVASTAVVADSQLAGTGLSYGTNALQLATGVDIGAYTGARNTQTSIAAYLPLLCNVANWTTQDASGDQGVDGTTPDVPFSVSPFTLMVPSTVSVGNASITEGNSGSTTLSLVVTRSMTSTAFSVDYAVTSGTATNGSDYTLSAGTLTFAADAAATLPINITVLGDAVIESNETVIVTLSNVVNVVGTTSITTATGTATLLNDDTVPVTFPATQQLSSTVKGSITLAGSEIPAFDPLSKRAFTSSNTGIQVVDLSNPAAPSFVSTITPSALGVSGLTSNDVSSITVRKGSPGNPSILAAAIISSPKTSPGYLILLDAATGALLGSTTVGANPDHICFTSDGSKLLVANEGELDGTAATIPDTAAGSVSIVDVTTPASLMVTTAGFAAFDSQVATLKAAGVRLFGTGLPSTDFEPEYIAISPDGTKAMVTLQEANALGVLDIATATFTNVVPLGQKDYSTGRHDFSDRDGASNSALVNPSTGSPVFGLYMPDAIAAYSSGGQTYYVTANEGDDRNDFLTPDESTTVSNAGYDLDNAAFPNEATLKTNAVLGRLTVSNYTGLRGDTDGDGDIDQILSYGGRSFSIHDATGARIFDSGDMIEMIVASQFPASFDDTRSDNKGPEPEGVTVSKIGSRNYAFIGLERSHLVLVFDVTNPASVTFATALIRPGDQNPEGMIVVSAGDSPTGKPLVLTSNEVSNTLSIFELGQSFEGWLAANGFSGTPAGDADNDGTADVVEYFFNTDPNSGDGRENLPHITMSGSDRELRFTYLNTSTFTAVVRKSDTLSAWANAVEGVDYELISQSASGSETTVRLRLQGSSTSKFFNLDVTTTP